MKNHHCTAENAPKFLDWIKTRGGVAVWNSIDLSDFGKQWSTPATIKLADCDTKGYPYLENLPKLCPNCYKPAEKRAGLDYEICPRCDKKVDSENALIAYQKPSWKSASNPFRVITDPALIDVCYDKEVKRFRVGVRMGGSGFCSKVTDGGTRRIRSATEKAGEGAYHVFDYETQEAVIMAPDKIVPLNEWKP